MRILVISDHADPLVKPGSKEAGGQNIYIFYLSKFLSAAGVKVDVFTRLDSRNKRPIVRVDKNFRVIRIQAGPKAYIPRDSFYLHLDKFTSNILKFVKQSRLKYDIIHTNYWFSGLCGLVIAKQLGRSQIHVFHSIGKIRFQTLKKYKVQRSDYALFRKRLAAEQKIARNVAGIIATSPTEKNSIRKIFKIDTRKITVIPIGVDRKIFHPPVVKLQQTGKKILLFVGRIEWRKGLGTLLFALREILKSYPNAVLKIIGGSWTKAERKLEKAELDRQQEIISQLKIGSAVQYLGPRKQEELWQYFSEADLTVVPSYYEPFGIVVLESMACGTPVVASKTGGLQYTILNGKTGYLAAPRNYHDLAKKIMIVLQKRKGTYQRYCLSRIKNHFSWEKVINQYLVYFNRLKK